MRGFEPTPGMIVGLHRYSGRDYALYLRDGAIWLRLSKRGVTVTDALIERAQLEHLRAKAYVQSLRRDTCKCGQYERLVGYIDEFLRGLDAQRH